MEIPLVKTPVAISPSILYGSEGPKDPFKESPKPWVGETMSPDRPNLLCRSDLGKKGHGLEPEEKHPGNEPRIFLQA